MNPFSSHSSSRNPFRRFACEELATDAAERVPQLQSKADQLRNR